MISRPVSSPKACLARLGRLTDAGLLTEAGADALPLPHALAAWGRRHTEAGEPTDPMQIVHVACGHPTADDRVCGNCGKRLERAEEAWLRPWRSATPFPLAEPVAAATDLSDR